MRLVLSGGGTGGHIIPNIALIHELRERSEQHDHSIDLLYIGSPKSMEQKMMADLNVPFVAVSCGKLRRYFSLRNFVDFFKVPLGIFQSLVVLWKFKPDVLFCKGGYVSLPVAVAGSMLKIPVILHESDLSPGLANRLCSRFASVICTSFEESKKYFKGKKVVMTGNPVRRELALGNKEKGKKFLGFSEDHPIILIMGGSTGAEFINKLVWRNLDYLLPHYQVVHICGKNKTHDSTMLLEHLQPEHHKYLKHYRSFEFLGQELKDVYAASDVLVSRAGAISLAEIDFVRKPSLLIPLGTSASRGDQILNAEAFAQDHDCKIFHQGEFSDAEFLDGLKNLLIHAKSAGVGHPHEDKFQPLTKIISLLESYENRR